LVNAAKNNIWIDGVHHKRAELRFQYEIEDVALRDTGPWHIHWADGDEAVDLHFTADHRRRERRSAPLVYDVDFHQHYGALTGVVRLEGQTYRLEDVFALCEDSWMVM
jgi:hypothetical protein